MGTIAQQADDACNDSSGNVYPVGGSARNPTVGIAVFPKAGGTPTTYRVPIPSLWCGYDDVSNLFVDSFASSQPAHFALAELPAKSNAAFSAFTVNNPYSVEKARQVQWDAHYMTVEATIETHPKHALGVLQLSITGSGQT